ncbi:MAG TPA: hypothetical protein VJO33_16375 [Gemmatimonadaceae bacterium]|nr:hypothetical protein [Gemmatimonadaceae bacterium]
MHRATVVALAIACVGADARAQIIRPAARVPEPKTWMSFSVGVMDMSAVHDGSTNSDWEFGNAVQYRISLEMPIQFQSTIGISGSFARVPLTYVPLDGIGTIGCAGSCDADATVTQLLATFHAGRSVIGFHQVLDLSLGATGYSGFRARISGERLRPMQLDADLTGGIGYGFGYTFSPDMQITLVQEGFLTVHQRTGVAGNEDTIGRQFVLRLGTRFGF